MNRNTRTRVVLIAAAYLSTFAPPALADSTPSKDLITPAVIKEIKAFLDKPIVMESIKNQNHKYGGLTQENIDTLDKQWRGETKSTDQPLISATLSNPVSSYLTRIQAHSIGLYTEMFVMDQNGLNVGQSNITSDYWQGDEDKFKLTYPKGKNAVFVDEAEQKEDTGIWAVQVNLALTDKDSGKNIGAATVEVNLTELQRRNNPKAEECPQMTSYSGSEE